MSYLHWYGWKWELLFRFCSCTTGHCNLTVDVPLTQEHWARWVSHGMGTTAGSAKRRVRTDVTVMSSLGAYIALPGLGAGVLVVAVN